MNLTRADVDLMPDLQRNAIYAQMNWKLPTLGKRDPSKPKAATPRGMNKLETDYSRHLTARQQNGEIIWWAFESNRVRLADGAFYKCDFQIITAEGVTEFHETKGFMREAANLRIKFAAEIYPYRFIIVRRKSGIWCFEVVPGKIDRLQLSPTTGA